MAHHSDRLTKCHSWHAPLFLTNATSNPEYSLKPKPGHLILFPGWVKHYVPEQQCDHERIILAGNLGVNPWELIEGMEKRGANHISESFKLSK